MRLKEFIPEARRNPETLNRFLQYDQQGKLFILLPQQRLYPTEKYQIFNDMAEKLL